MEKRYTALRIISVLYKVLGVIVGLVTLLVAVIILVSAPTSYTFGIIRVGFGETIFAVLIEVIGGGLTAVGIYAIGEMISLFINIEENTRFTALVVRDRLQPQPVQPPPQVYHQAPPQPPYQPPAQPPYQPPTPPPQQVPPPYQPPEG